MLREGYPLARTVLDVGAGTGALSRELVSRGFEVHAIEPCPQMAQRIWGMRTEVSVTSLQDFDPGDRKYDIAVAYYDVLNYVPFSDIEAVMTKLHSCCGSVVYDVWTPSDGIRHLQFRRDRGVLRTRLAFRLFGRVHMLFCYLGRCLPRMSYHRMYMHDPEELQWLGSGYSSTSDTKASAES